MLVKHKQIYSVGLFGGILNSTLCGRAKRKTSKDDYHNIAEEKENDPVTCKFCLKIMKEERYKKILAEHSILCGEK